MAGTIKISTDQVEAIATSIENNNKKLKSTLEDKKLVINMAGRGCTKYDFCI